ncbi:hypothetical protein BKH41_04050 [Helicobacter sp. 12S02232-10]|uniref:two-partner secretion domain-containing protein n=1 Tax=Helicobacter sp. 12S02232-10 TaxID=1476197 RepID=UPI000BA6921B|nr:hemagglutinin repeat-containing protein [Helicobacter sp. 12S02232-10]PAF49260.1 hypothetical protein BKH41_04050 [Helicobacter sp. 12S02232-10]
MKNVSLMCQSSKHNDKYDCISMVSIPKEKFFSRFFSQRFLIGVVCISLVSARLLSAADNVPDVLNAPLPEPLPLTPDKGTFAPQVIKAHNDVPIVNITSPNAAGISNNAFKDFNVDKSGLIFNNIKDSPSLTQLSGYINANPNLNGSLPAKLILNQVTSSHISTLLGYMEVAGNKADVIIANPNGIDCNGCGFINTANATMIAGKLSEEFNEHFLMMKNMQDAMQSLQFEVKNGRIHIGDFNGKNLQALNLISNALVIDGKIDAIKIAMILGQNDIVLDPTNASVLLFRPILMPADDKDGEKPALALDVAYSGGVYANSIYLVATQEGVGVKNSGTLATFASSDGKDGGFIIHSNGDIEITKPAPLKTLTPTADTDTTELSNASEAINADPDAPIHLNGSTPMIYAGGDLEISASSIQNYSIIYGEKNISIKTEGNIDNLGEMALVPEVVSVEPGFGRDEVADNYKEYTYTTTITQDKLKKGSYHPAIIYAKGALNLDATLINNTNSIIATPQGELHNQANLNNTTPIPRRVEEKEGTMKEYDRYGGGCGISGIFGKHNWNCHSKTNYNPYHPAPEISMLTVTDLHIPTIPLEEMMADYVNALIDEYNATPYPYVKDTNPAYQTPSAFLHTADFQSSVADSAPLSAIRDKMEINNQLNVILGKPSSSADVGVGITAKEAHLNASSRDGNLYNTSSITTGLLYLGAQDIRNTNGVIHSNGDINVSGKDFSSDSGRLEANGDIRVNATNVSIKTEKTNNTADAFLGSRLLKIFGFKPIFSSNNDTLNPTSSIKAKNLYINAKDTLLLKGADIKTAQNMKFKAKDIKITTANVKNYYSDNSRTDTTAIAKSSKLQSGGDIILEGSNDLDFTSVDMGASGDIDLYAGGKLTMDVARNENSNIVNIGLNRTIHKENNFLNNKITSNNISIYSYGDVNLASLELKSDNNINLESENNASLSGVKANAIGNIKMRFDQNLDMGRVTDARVSDKVIFNNSLTQLFFRDKLLQKTIKVKQDTEISGNNVSIVAGNAVMKAVQFNSNNDLSIKTKDLDIDVIATDIDQSHRNKIDLSTVNDISVIRGGNIHIDSDNFKMTSADLKADKNVVIAASGDVTMDTAQNTTYTSETTKTVKRGFFSEETTTTTITEKTAKNLANTIDGESVNIFAGGSTTAYNLASVSKNFGIFSKEGTTLSNKADSYDKTTNVYTEKRGFAGGFKDGKLSVSYGKDTQDMTLSQSDSKHHNQTIVSDKITLMSGSADIRVESADLETNQMEFKSDNVLVSSLEDGHTSTQNIKTTSDRVGIELEVPTRVTDILTNKNNILAKAAGKTILNVSGKISGFKTISKIANANIDGKDIAGTYQMLKTDVKSIIQNPKISVGYKHSDSYDHTTTIAKTASTSSISAQNLNIISKNTTDIIGSDINAQNMSVTANNFNVSSAKESLNTVSHSDSVSDGVGAKISINNVGANAAYHKSENNTSTSFANSKGSNLNVGNLNIKSLESTNIEGSHLNANTANIETQNFTLSASENAFNTNTSTSSYGGKVKLAYNGAYQGEIKGDYSHSLSYQNRLIHQGSTFDVKNLNLNAKDDMNLIGSAINVKNSAKISAANLNISATQNKKESNFDSRNIKGVIKGEIGVSKVGFGGEILGGLEHSGSSTNFYDSATLSGGKLDIVVAKNMNITGGNVSADHLSANIGKNLSIATTIDTGSSNSGLFEAHMAGGYGTGEYTGFHSDYNFKILDSSDQNLSQVAGISSDVLDISVGDTTMLKGSYINSNASDVSKLNTNKIVQESVSTNSHTLSLIKDSPSVSSYKHTQTTSGITGVNIVADDGNVAQTPQKTYEQNVSTNFYFGVPNSILEEMNKPQKIISLTQDFNNKFSQSKGISKIGNLADYAEKLYETVVPDELKSQISKEFNK